MPILKLRNIHTVAVAVMLLLGCDDKSSAYQHIMRLPYSDWNKYAASLSVEDRMSLHRDILDKSGHNPKMTIVSSFYNNPEESYAIIVDHVRRGDGGRYYLDVIYEINRNPSFDMCKKHDRRVVQRYLWSMATDAIKKEDRPKFYSC